MDGSAQAFNIHARAFRGEGFVHFPLRLKGLDLLMEQSKTKKTKQVDVFCVLLGSSLTVCFQPARSARGVQWMKY